MKSLSHLFICCLVLACGFTGRPARGEAPVAEATPLVDKPVSVVKPVFLGTYRKGVGVSGKCDVYSPMGELPPSGFPVVLVIHGGGWMAGDKWTMGDYCRNLANAGFLTVSMNYRHAPAHKFPAQADDVRQALVWLSQQRESLHLDLERVGLFGYSAGGHLASLIGLASDEPIEKLSATSTWAPDDPRWNKLPAVKAICAGGPPCDFRTLPEDNTTLAFFLGGSRRELPDVYRAASPMAHISSNDPPIQIIHGDRDIIVPYAGSVEMLSQLQRAGVESELVTVAGQGHMVTFVHPLTKQTMLQFFQQTL